ncbi:putative aminopeptidase [Tritrichomonas foetus]|uniref:Aminopeptidase n=1 Tax=Tritrichomonas foetus TaxID=1144522 RepID=A0A1J4KCB8_9EUKA|nr:putative aminopeptidase [Tritrichomonas foetus]|eukprot:OHT08867.1 putative aminopeptidase [Tritrichomonas foetus]
MQKKIIYLTSSNHIMEEVKREDTKINNQSNSCQHLVDTQEIKDIARDALKLTQKIIDDFGPRLCGSESCQNAAESLLNEMKKHCMKTYKEEFDVHPDAFFGFIKVGIVCFMCSTICVFLNQLFIGLLFSLFGVLQIIFEYIFYYHFLDRFYPKKTGYNVYGVIDPEGEVKRNVILSGHHDSAHIFNFYYDNPELYMVREIRGFLLILLLFITMVVINVMKFRRGDAFELSFTTTYRIILGSILFLLFFWVQPLWYFLNEKGTPGAGDNLASSSMIVMLSKYMKERRLNGKDLKNTRVYFCSFDGEECGLRGARAFWRKHKKEFELAPTYNINADCPYYYDELRFLTKDINWTVNLSEELASACVEAAKEQGFEARKEPIRFLCGATDAGEAALNGVKATTLLSIPFTNADRPTVYHTPDDVVEHVEPRAIEQALAVMVNVIDKLDDNVYKDI